MSMELVVVHKLHVYQYAHLLILMMVRHQGARIEFYTSRSTLTLFENTMTVELTDATYVV